MADKKRGLGRGLSALIGDVDIGLSADAKAPTKEKSKKTSTLSSEESSSQGLRTLGVEKLVPGKFQPRREFDKGALRELANSIREKGILQPILARPNPDGGAKSPYEIVAGERRWRAAQIAQLHDVPVIVRDMTDNEALQIGIIENVQRSDLSPIEEAEGFQRLIDEFSYTQEVLAKTLGKSRSHIANTLRLVGATNKVREYLVAGQLSAGHARALLGHPSADRLASDIVKQGLSVRDVEKLVADKKPSKGGSKSKKPAEKDTDTRALEKSIADNLGLSVAIQHEKDGGHVRVSYKTLEQLDEVVRRLMASS
ncbi:putative intracellular septation protein A [Candidatus Micropelagos thuwalensis]|uniref:Putative intracellular septation protein A n=1 Tax=Candidatus Micropelagius thuwalensis TaxID=1397666 RepID=U2XV34_9PROT|nr:ParB/RepB/Spo0J family partition protein [Candidatus Micropelagos thuwalensis]ERL46626.1 putative intracellular septation protein A [Candidatus Micropelagos thuwalensis]